MTNKIEVRYAEWIPPKYKNNRSVPELNTNCYSNEFIHKGYLLDFIAVVENVIKYPDNNSCIKYNHENNIVALIETENGSVIKLPLEGFIIKQNNNSNE